MPSLLKLFDHVATKPKINAKFDTKFGNRADFNKGQSDASDSIYF